MVFDYLKNKSLTTRRNLAVLVPELAVAPVAALGAVLCASKLTPKQLNNIIDVVADHIVEPHLAFFNKLEGSIRHAHKRHEEEKREALIRAGLPVPEAKDTVITPKEKAHYIAEALVKGTLALGFDLGATFLAQKGLNKALDARIPAGKTTFLEGSVHLGGIALMALPLARISENINHGISKTVRNALGASERRAEDVAVPLTYITLPGWVAAALSLRFAHRNGIAH